MPALDTNVLVRFLIQDDRAQLAVARQAIERCVQARQVLFVPVTVTLELEWVLRSRFELAKTAIIQVLSALLAAAELTLESEGAIEMALDRYADSSADFSDCVHAALAVQAGHAPLWTFDRAAAKVDGAQLLGG